jgi:hypothetical protein
MHHHVSKSDISFDQKIYFVTKVYFNKIVENNEI